MYEKVLVLLSISLLTKSNPILDGRIVGGELAQIIAHPYQLSLQYNGAHICGASLIGYNVALTAAHCVEGGIRELFTIYAGSSSINTGGLRVNVLSITPHRFYNKATSDYDIAIVKFRSNLPFGKNIIPIALPNLNEEISVNTNAIVTGWGHEKEGGNVSHYLRKAMFPVMDQATCKRFYEGNGIITIRMFCAGFKTGGRDSCQGDSGGPLVANGKLFGIVSWGYGCARSNFPGVYTKVSKFNGWILKRMY